MAPLAGGEKYTAGFKGGLSLPRTHELVEEFRNKELKITVYTRDIGEEHQVKEMLSHAEQAMSAI